MNHKLVVVYRHGNDESEAVVRWCKHCGAIVVDADCDGHTNAGRFVKMMIPEADTAAECAKRNEAGE